MKKTIGYRDRKWDRRRAQLTTFAKRSGSRPERLAKAKAAEDKRLAKKAKADQIALTRNTAMTLLMMEANRG